MAGYSSYIADFHAGGDRVDRVSLAGHGKLCGLFCGYGSNKSMVHAVCGECHPPRGNRYRHSGDAWDGVAPTIAQPLVDVFCAHTGHMVVRRAGCGFYIFSVLIFFETKIRHL